MIRKTITAMLILGMVSSITLYVYLNNIYAEPKKIIKAEDRKKLVNLIASWRISPGGEGFGGFNVTSSEISYNYKGYSSAKECYYDGDRYILPIYGGTEPPVDFGNMDNYINDWDKRCGTEDYCINSPAILITYIRIKKPDNIKTKDFFQDVLRFYRDKGYIKNIDKPSGFGIESGTVQLTYDFKQAGSYGHINIEYFAYELGPVGYLKRDNVKISELYFLKDKECWLGLSLRHGMSSQKLSMPIWERWKY
jgi:hypothetical protein